MRMCGIKFCQKKIHQYINADINVCLLATLNQALAESLMLIHSLVALLNIPLTLRGKQQNSKLLGLLSIQSLRIYERMAQLHPKFRQKF